MYLKEEYEVGAIFYNAGSHYLVCKSGNTCHGCAFETPEDDLTGDICICHCGKDERQDGHDVIFKEVEIVE